MAKVEHAAAQDKKQDKQDEQGGNATRSQAGAGAGTDEQIRRDGTKKLRRLWYDENNREIIVYYLIAVFCLELIVGAVAFFYGVTNAEPLVAGGPRMARFPWVGWIVASVLSPVGLLLLLHLSGQFFSRSLNGQESAGGTGGGSGGDGVVPERVQHVYTIVRHAPTIVILLGLLAMGCAILFLDSAFDMAMAVGAALKPYILWILGAVVFFLLAGYLGRLYFITRHKRMEQEYAYRMQVLEKTGVVIMNKGALAMRYEDGQLKLLAKDDGGELKALPQQSVEHDAGDTDGSRAGDTTGTAGRPAKEDETEVEDATIVSR